MRIFNVTLKSDQKEAFKKKIEDSGIKEMTVFFVHFINKYVKGEISQKELCKIILYQEKDPGKIKDLNDYIKLQLEDDLHLELTLKRVKDGIKPQHLLRYYMIKFLDGKITPEEINQIKSEYQMKIKIWGGRISSSRSSLSKKKQNLKEIKKE